MEYREYSEEAQRSVVEPPIYVRNFRDGTLARISHRVS